MLCGREVRTQRKSQELVDSERPGLWSRLHTRRTLKGGLGRTQGAPRGQLAASEVGLVISLAGPPAGGLGGGRPQLRIYKTKNGPGPHHGHLPESEKESYQVRGFASAEQHSGVNLNRNSMTRDKCNYGWA